MIKTFVGKTKKMICILMIIALLSFSALCGSSCFVVEQNTDAKKYKGHGFDYMHGLSTTDFTGYHVYDGEKLVKLSFLIPKPPVPAVAVDVHMASNRGRPPKIKKITSMIVRAK